MTNNPKNPPSSEEFDMQETYTKAETFVNDNKQAIGVVVTIIAVAVLAFFGYKKFYLEPQADEAQSQIFMAQQYFAQDSLQLALNGDGNYLGFLEIADEYSSTQAGNLANYYIGISYLRMGQYEAAIEHLEKFESDDIMVNTMAKGAQGDAYWEMGNTQEAIQHYLAAADENENEFTTPMYLMKAGRAMEEAGKFEEAKEAYNKIKEKYPESQEGREIEKYIARAEAKTTK